MKNNLKILYNNTSWTLSDEIKSVTVIKEIDITKMSAPTTAVDITLKCTLDTDLDFALDCPCDVYDNDTPIFKLYVSDSARNSDYEWKLSLYGALGRMASKKYYGGVYGDPADYTSLDFYKEGVYYIPTISDIAGIIDDISSVSGANITYDSSVFPLVNETLHRVGMPIGSSRDGLLNAAFVLGAQMRDEYGSVILFKPNETVKQISDERILNDAKIQKVDLVNIKLYTYEYNMRKAGAIFYITNYYYDSNNVLQRQGQAVYNCNIIPRDTPTSDGRVNEISSGYDENIGTKTADENRIIEYKNPISTYNMQLLEWGSQNGKAPMHPNYADIDEKIQYPDAVKYDIEENVIDLVINSDSENDPSEIKVRLVSPEIAELISERVKNDFSYNRIATVNIVEGYDKNLYGEHKFGECKFGYNEQEAIDIGDKVKFNIRSKSVEGYITRVKYNLNGTIIIKNCEVTYKE